MSRRGLYRKPVSRRLKKRLAAVAFRRSCTSVPRDRVYRWSSLLAGREGVDDEIAGWPIGDKDHWPRLH